jgi:phage major head subunit gpT-like protein
MELNNAALAGFRTRYEAIFNAAFNLAEPKAEKVALVFQSGRVEQVVHRWMRGLKGMREFTDTRQINNVDTDGLTVTNKLWEDTLGIRRVDLERDQYKVYDPLVARLGQTAKLHRDKLVFEQLSDALADPNIKDYAGDSFYGDHTTKRVASAQYNNKSSAPLSENSLITAIQSLRNRRDSEGNVLASAAQGRPLLVVPPALEFTAAKLANLSFYPTTQPGTGASSATSQAAAGENILKGTFDYIVSPYLKTATEWHLCLQDNYYKPIIFQIEQEIEFLPWDRFIAQWAMNDLFVFGVRALYNVAVGLPEMTFGSTGA